MSDNFSRKVWEVGPNPWKVVERKMKVLMVEREEESERLKELELINAERRRLAKRNKDAEA